MFDAPRPSTVTGAGPRAIASVRQALLLSDVELSLLAVPPTASHFLLQARGEDP